jgi:asparagine synthase (glutamine-hydrolysing)
MLRSQSIYAPDPTVIRCEGAIALGRRLFRTVPEDRYDHGPVVGGGGRWILVADVRLDDRETICAKLGIQPDEAATLADSAIVMRAIERWEEAALSKLVGEFAIALWDRDRESLVLARDFLGKRPLHFHRCADFVAFASMPKGLLALPEIPTGPDEQTVAEFIALMPLKGSGSFFRGAERVLPGELVRISRSHIARTRHWDFEPKSLNLRSPQEYAEAVREVFDRAVTSCLRGSEGKIASHLSGGLDSSAVAATAATLYGSSGAVTAYTSAPRSDYGHPSSGNVFYDESSHAAAVAALYPNMEHIILRTGGRSPLGGLDRNFLLYDSPLLNLSNGVWLDAILDDAKERGLKILLTGQLGNMTFSYSGVQRLSGLLSRGHLVQLAKETFLLRRRGTPLRSTAAQTFGPFLPATVWRAIQRASGRRAGAGTYCAIHPKRLEDLDRLAEARGFQFDFQPGRDPLANRLRVLGRVDHGNYHKGVIAGWGIDTRDPTADRRLLELCLSIPTEQYLRGGTTRALARRAFRERLPQVVVGETRKGYQAADWHEGLRADWSGAVREAQRIAEVPAAAAVLDTAKMTRLLEARPRGRWNGREQTVSYRLALLRGLSAGHFLRKATGSN